ncbi:chondroitin synthase [Holotrichia oblita]|uniref:Chondroitin synthase n=2 Tax=Holotrichia oblita TaxID=644536 RepID=A0ACB9SUE4_HOLOL|nr:chondroitin synthase [Holotrichia oblita]KAI4458338.1 chondroitin synthase [Holotrichia oblita]
MARRRKVPHIVFGIMIGVILYVSVRNINRHTSEMCKPTADTVRRKIADPEALIRENVEEQLVFVGVMTAAKYLETRAKTVYETWGKNVPGQMVFFSSEYSQTNSVPLIPLSGVDDSYPPQKKSFFMLKYMHDHFIDKFEWFIRADDDVYMRTDRLENLLRSVDSRKPWFIGQTGRGNSEEFGLLSLESDENFCMGGPGVIFSRETLRRIAPYIEECLMNLYTTHEDVEVGRCVRKFAGISCTWSYEAGHNFKAREVLSFFVVSSS